MKHELTYNIHYMSVEDFLDIVTDTGITCKVINAISDSYIANGKRSMPCKELDRDILTILFESNEDMILVRLLLKDYEEIECRICSKV